MAAHTAITYFQDTSSLTITRRRYYDIERFDVWAKRYEFLRYRSELPKVLLDKMALLDLSSGQIPGVGERDDTMNCYHLYVNQAEADAVFNELGLKYWQYTQLS